MKREISANGCNLKKTNPTLLPMTQLARPETIHLSNGISVILQDYPGTVAATYWWIRAGSADEKKGEEGFAHFLEHMLFKDSAAKETGKASTGQTAREIESLGGDINAYTSFDQTVYHFSCAATHWERILDVFGRMAAPQKFLKSDFVSEREVILEELRKNEDSPDRQLFQSLFSATFHKHPYGRPVIGTVKSLKAATVTELEAFYKRNYISGNMGLVLVGPMGDEKSPRRKQIIQKLERYFGAKVFKKTEAHETVRALEPALRKAPTILSRNFDVTSPSVSVSFRAPDLMDPDIPALDITAHVLGMGELSRLYQRLFYGSAIVNEVSAGLYVPKDPGMFYFQLDLDDVSKIKPALEQALDEIRKLREEGPTAAELDRIIVNTESERLYSTQTVDGMASRLGFLGFGLKDMAFDRTYLDELKATRPEKVKEVLKNYLTLDRLNAVFLLPKKEKKFDLKPFEKMFSDAFKPAAKSVKLPRTQTEILPTVTVRPSGIQLIQLERPVSHAFSVHMAVQGGLRLEISDPLDSSEKDWGVSNLLSMTWAKSTRLKDAKEIASIVEGSAASLDGFSGRNTIGLQLTGLARDWGKLSSLMGEILVEPTFVESELEHSRRVVEESIKSIEDHSGQLCSKLFLENLFEKHPYGKSLNGTLESVKGISSEKLLNYHRTWVRPERITMAVSGAVSRNQVEDWVSEWEMKLVELRKNQPTRNFPKHLPEEKELQAPKWIEKNLKREQVHILTGGLGIRLTDPERRTLRLMQTILGGQSGRLFIELREKKSLAYTVSPTAFEGMERGYLGTYIACSPEKRDEAIKGIHEVYGKLAAKGPTPSEMKRAQEFYLGRRAMDLQSDSSFASHYALDAVYGLKLETEEEVMKAVRKITPKEIQLICEKYFVKANHLTVAVG